MPSLPSPLFQPPTTVGAGHNEKNGITEIVRSRADDEQQDNSRWQATCGKSEQSKWEWTLCLPSPRTPVPLEASAMKMEA
jgi:hypothetical protein